MSKIETQNIINRVIIGGSPSTGSSLLRRILNRHSQILSGEETSLFSKKELYTDWNKAKHKLFSKAVWGLRSHGWHNYAKVDLVDNEYGWTQKTIQDLIHASDDFSSFADAFFYPKMQTSKNQIWVEKTPTNVFLFPEFKNTFNGKTIHIIRHPLDTIASLVARGHSIYAAISKYLIFTNFGAKATGNNDHITIRYESLVSSPEETIKNLCAFLNVAFEESMLIDGDHDARTVSKMKGWQYDETEEIGRGSVGRFKACSPVQRKQMLYAWQSIFLKQNYMDAHQLKCRDMDELSSFLGYELSLNRSNVSSYAIASERRSDMLHRSFRLYPNHLFNYPVALKK